MTRLILYDIFVVLPDQLCYRINSDFTMVSKIEDYNLKDMSIKPESISKLIAQQIIQFIKDYNLKSGDKIPSEKQLMEKMEVGRSSVREALHALVALDILESKPGKGYYVTGKSNIFSLPWENNIINPLIEDQDFMHLLEVREVLEKRIATLAVRRTTEDQIQKLEDIMDEIRELAKQRDNISDVTVKLHLTLAEATQNPIFVQLMNKIVPLIVTKATDIQLPAKKEVEIHTGLVSALKTRDEEKIRDWVQDHLDYLRERWIQFTDKDRR